MGQEKNNKGVIIILIAIIIILAVLCILFATGTINLRNKTTTSNKEDETDEYFQFYKEYSDEEYTLYELMLTNDKKANYCVTKVNSGSYCAKGTYNITDNNIVFSGKMYLGPSDNDITIKFIREGNTIYEELGKIYSMTKVSKEDLKLLFATGTISVKDNATNDDNKVTNSNSTTNTNSTTNNNTNSTTNNNTNATTSAENLQNWTGEYTGTDPWNEKVTIKLTSISENKLEWTFSNDYCEKAISSNLINNTTSFHIQGTCSDNQHGIDYSVVLMLKDNDIVFKYVSGYMMSIAPTGNASFNNVGPLTESEKTVVLKK